MTKQEIKSKFDEIVHFAGVERYIDTPVKRYSSGMYVRLAFGVAAHLEPEILIVDEVLAVGDAEFQKKALGKMKDVSEKDGRTVLFVSHDLANINKLTNRCILMQHGEISLINQTSVVVDNYLNQDFKKESKYKNKSSVSTPNIIAIDVITSQDNNLHHFGKELKLEFEINIPNSLDIPIFSFQIFNSKVQPVLNFFFDKDSLKNKAGVFLLTCILPNPKLYKGKYCISAYFGEQRSQQHFESVEFVCPFEIIMIEGESNLFLNDVCAYIENSDWEVK